MTENNNQTIVDEIASLARQNKTPHYKEIIKKIKNQCALCHKIEHSSYGDDYVMNYAMAKLTKEQLEADGFDVEMKQTAGTSSSGQKGGRDGTFTLIVSGWIE